LTGLIPAATDLGLSLKAREGISLTTGHSATAASMALTISAVSTATGRDFREETVGFVGLGAIGTASLRTMIGCVAHPRALTLCDVPAKRGYLESLVHELRVAHGFRGEIDVAITTGRLPEKAYQSTFFVGATNVPDVIEIDRLKPGSIVVDDSFPLCFDLQKAKQRFDRAGDIVCVSGGSVALDSPITWNLAVPPGFTVAGSVKGSTLLPSSTAITGCILSSLMPTLGLDPTIGAVSLSDCTSYWDGFARARIKAAPLHCGAWTLTARDLYRFRAQASAADQRLVLRGEERVTSA